MKNLFIFAHRGVPDFAPENTLPAFKMAMELNCDGIEFDVQLSRDSIPVIIHDETLERTTTGEGYVKDFDLAELQKFDAGIKFSNQYKDTQIPTLEAFFKLVEEKAYTGLINVELKTDMFDYDGIEQIVLDLINTYKLKDQIVVSSFNHKTIDRVRKIDKDIKVGLLYGKDQIPNTEDLDRVAAYSANTNFKDTNQYIVEDIHKKGYKIFCYTVNSKEDIEAMIDLGIDGIFCNNPALAMGIRNSE